VAVLAHTSAGDHVGVVVLGLAAISLYGWGWVRRPGAPGWTLASWVTGVSLSMMATMPLVESWADESFTGHMVQHLVLIVLVAPCLVIAQPVRTFRHLPFGPDRASPADRPVARWWRRFGAAAAPVAFLAVLYLTHLTSVYEWALDNRLIHHAEHLAYLAGAVALWAAVLAPGRRTGAARVGTALAVIAGTALLGAILTTAGEPLIPSYVEELGTAGALDDQRRAASVMWAGGMALTLPLLLTSVWVWASAEERVARRTEAILDARAAAANRSADSPSDERNDAIASLRSSLSARHDPR
jgi:putative membrane protein